MSKEKVDFQQILARAKRSLPLVQRYSVPAFIVFVVLIYGIVIFRIQTLSAKQPTDEQVSSQVQASGIPHIDQSVVKQLQTLQDNSVNVQALFNQARNNPFQQ
jgi:hypothetical protein